MFTLASVSDLLYTFVCVRVGDCCYYFKYAVGHETICSLLLVCWKCSSSMFKIKWRRVRVPCCTVYSKCKCKTKLRIFCKVQESGNRNGFIIENYILLYTVGKISCHFAFNICLIIILILLFLMLPIIGGKVVAL